MAAPSKKKLQKKLLLAGGRLFSCLYGIFQGTTAGLTDMLNVGRHLLHRLVDVLAFLTLHFDTLDVGAAYLLQLAGRVAKLFDCPLYPGNGGADLSSKVVEGAARTRNFVIAGCLKLDGQVAFTLCDVFKAGCKLAYWVRNQAQTDNIASDGHQQSDDGHGDGAPLCGNSTGVDFFNLCRYRCIGFTLDDTGQLHQGIRRLVVFIPSLPQVHVGFQDRIEKLAILLEHLAGSLTKGKFSVVTLADLAFTQQLGFCYLFKVYLEVAVVDLGLFTQRGILWMLDQGIQVEQAAQ